MRVKAGGHPFLSRAASRVVIHVALHVALHVARHVARPRALHVALLGALLGGLLQAACRTRPLAEVATVAASQTSSGTASADLEAAPRPALGDGAAPGGEEGPGGFVPRGTRGTFYTGPGGRLWYYLNHYYWAPETAPLEGLWIEAKVVERFTDLRRWPRGESVPPTEDKVTIEYWAVGPGGRSVRLDNHKDYCLLDDHYTEGAIEVRITLTLGRVALRDEGETWSAPAENYVLAFRNYREDRGIGLDRVRFEPLATEAVTVWGYRIPWSTHPERLTRSSWRRLEVPAWRLLERRAPSPAEAAPEAPSSLRPVLPEPAPGAVPEPGAEAVPEALPEPAPVPAPPGAP